VAIDAAAIENALEEVAPAARAGSYSAYFVRHRARYASDASTLGRVLDRSNSKSRVLEIGSYPGHFTAVLHVLGVPYVSVDIAPERLDLIRQRFPLDVRRCDIERHPLPFDDCSLSCVVCNEVFEHLRVDPLFALSEINRVLRPDGHLLLTTPNLYAVQQCVRFLAGRGFGNPLEEFNKLRTVGHMGHVREYSHREMRNFLEHAGFRVHELRYKHYYFGPGKRGLVKRILFAVLPARFRTFQVIMARKVGDVVRLAPLP